jgi:hypothetical protein
MTNSTKSEILARYKGLILLSLAAQEHNDVAQEDRIIDDLDVLWSKMSLEERRQSEGINQKMIVWYSRRDRRTEQLMVGSAVSPFGSVRLAMFEAAASGPLGESGSTIREIRPASPSSDRVAGTVSRVSLIPIEPSAFAG